MVVKFNLLTFYKSVFSQLNNVVWCRFTENKVMLECSDGRKQTLRLKDVVDLEITA